MKNIDRFLSKLFGLMPKGKTELVIETTTKDPENENEVIMFDYLQKSADSGKLGIPVK